MKTVLLSPEVMAHPQTEGVFILDTEASNTCTRALLLQIQSGEEKVIAYGSKSLSTVDRNYCVTNS